MSNSQTPPTPEELEYFTNLCNEHRYDFFTLAHIIFPFGEPGSDLEHEKIYDWQREEWDKMSAHWANPYTRDIPYKLAISTGNGSGKTAFIAMTVIMIMYTHATHARLTSNTEKQTQQVIWPQWGEWLARARYSEFLFDRLGTAIVNKKNQKWRLDTVTWSEDNVAGISGLHNKGHDRAVGYVFEEAAGIPAKIWDYASGAMTDTNTLKFFFAVANSDDPNSKLEQCMSDPGWHSRRIDTRTLPHVNQAQIAEWLRECGGDEDHDEFRRKVRGLPGKSAKDAIIRTEWIEAAIERGRKVDMSVYRQFPSILTVDPAWTGGDRTCIWHHQGPVSTLLDSYVLDKARNEDHNITFKKLLKYEKELEVDAVFIDQAEGTALKTMGNLYHKNHWVLVSFSQNPNDTVERKDSEYHNMRAQLYFEAGKDLMGGTPILRFVDPYMESQVKAELGYAKAMRSKQSLKKLVAPKEEIKEEYGRSPDLADGYVLKYAYTITERLPEHQHLVPRPEGYELDDSYEMPYEDPNYD